MYDVLIPIAAIAMSAVVSFFFFAVLAIPIVLTAKNARKRRAEIHEERMLAMEKGLSLPEELKPAFNTKRRFLGSMQAGLVCLMAGIGVAIALGLVVGWAHASWGGILFFIGLGFIIFAIVVQASAKDPNKLNGDNDK